MIFGLIRHNLISTQIQKKGRYTSREGAPEGALNSNNFMPFIWLLIFSFGRRCRFHPRTNVEYRLRRELIIFWSLIEGWSIIESDRTRTISTKLLLHHNINCHITRWQYLEISINNINFLINDLLHWWLNLHALKT